MQNRRSFSGSESLSPNKSPIRSLPESHIIENRYRSYHRAEDYIKHLNNIYNSHVVTSGIYDEAYYNTYKFRLQPPIENALYKVSQFPRSKIDKELLKQQELINAFNHISYENKSKNKPRPKSTLPQSYKRHSRERSSFSYKQVKLQVNDKCENCHKNVCQCQRQIKDNFLKSIMKKQLKIVEKPDSGSVYGKTRIDQYVIDTKNIKFSPEKLENFDEIFDKQISLKKKRKFKGFRVSPKKNDLNFAIKPIEDSLNISSVNLSRRKSSKIE